MKNQAIVDLIDYVNLLEGKSFTYEDAEEILLEGNNVSREEYNNKRWWIEYDYVVKIGERFWKYIHAEANRDESVEELGFDWDENSVQEVEEHIEIKEVKYYKPINK